MKESDFSSKEDALEKVYRTAYLVASFRQTLIEETHNELDG